MKSAPSSGAMRLGRDLARWRGRHGGRGRRIPERLWAEAVTVARREGVEATARALRLDQQRLKERVGDGGGSSAAFVEVSVTPAGEGGRLLVELVARGGDQMRIHLAGPNSAALVELARAFWSRES